MKQSLQLKMSQQLTMTPQLQQAIRLLQLSTLELKTEIQEALEKNPLLETEENDSTPSDDESPQDQNSEAKPEHSEATTNENSEQQAQQDPADTQQESMDLDTKSDIPDDLPVDSAWEDVYQSSGPASSATDEEGLSFDERNGTQISLIDHLMWQLNLTPLSEVDRAIGESIIEALDTNGYLTASLADIAETVNKNPPVPSLEEPVEEDEVLAIVHLVQSYDPPGIAARDLAECLAIQLKQLPEDTTWRKQALSVVEQHIDLLGQRDFNGLMRKTKLSEDELKLVMELIRTLHPHPGVTIEPDKTEYIVPDVIVRKNQDRWLVELNPDTTPKLRINTNYAALAQTATSSKDGSYIKNNLQEAKWFLKSLQSRNETLLKVATKIVEFQRGFFEYGAEAMKPLVLHDIAEAVEMHESTISRVTTQKYMHTPYGIFELKYFFSSHVSTTTGGECSSTAIRAIIKKLIAAENPKKPLSDSKIANLLAEQQIKVARRTVAKYRESMVIPPSNERKRLV